MSENTEHPKYRQCNPHGFFADDDTLYPEHTEFFWLGTPNEFMEPLNEPARKAIQKFHDALEAGARAMAEKMGRVYIGRSKDIADQLAQLREDERIQAEAKAIGKTPSQFIAATRRQPGVQGHLNADGSTKRGRGRPPKISITKMPEAPKAPEAKPVAILGKDFAETLPIRG